MRIHGLLTDWFVLELGKGWRWVGAFGIFAVLLVGCAGISPHADVPVVVPQKVALTGGDSEALNYSTDYIYSYEFEAPGGVRGGGATVDNVRSDGRPGEGGGVCCTSLPIEWQPTLRLTVHWLAYQMNGGNVVKNWYTAENVGIPRYDGQKMGTTWAIFLPGERIRIMVPDGIDPNGGNNPDIRPPDSDPYIAQGILDEQWNRLYLNKRRRAMRLEWPESNIGRWWPTGKLSPTVDGICGVNEQSNNVAPADIGCHAVLR